MKGVPNRVSLQSVREGVEHLHCSARACAQLVADGLLVRFPVWPLDCIDAKVRHLLPIRKLICWILWISDETRCQLNDFVQVVLVVAVLNVRKSVEHLDRALGVAYVENLVVARLLFDEGDGCGIVIEAHFGPGPFPVFLIVSCERFVAETVLCTAIVAHPDVITSISQLQRHGLASFITAGRRWGMIV